MKKKTVETLPDTTYNGWKNYETWNYKLWLDNDQGTQEYWAEQARNCWDNAKEEKYLTRKDNAIYELSELLKADVEENVPDIGCSFYLDILHANLHEIDYREVAEAIIDDNAITNRP